jgi:hypothetical protein
MVTNDVHSIVSNRSSKIATAVQSNTFVCKHLCNRLSIATTNPDNTVAYNQPTSIIETYLSGHLFPTGCNQMRLICRFANLPIAIIYENGTNEVVRSSMAPIILDCTPNSHKWFYHQSAVDRVFCLAPSKSKNVGKKHF